MAAAALVGLATVGIGLQVHAREEARSAERASRRKQETANQVQQAQNSVNRARERRRAIAQARIAQAQNAAIAAQQGTTGSSPLEGAQSSISTNLATSIAAANRSFVSGSQTFQLRQDAANIMAAGQRRAQDFQALSGLAMQGASLYSSFASPASTTPSNATYVGAGPTGLGRYQVNP